MNPIVDLKTLPERLRSLGKRVVVAIASPADSHTEEVIERSINEGIADFILTVVDGKQAIAEQLATKHPQQIKIINASDDDDAARKAVSEVREGRADVLMKGTLNTDNLLRAVLNKEHGILVKGSVLTHIAVAEIPDPKNIKHRLYASSSTKLSGQISLISLFSYVFYKIFCKCI